MSGNSVMSGATCNEEQIEACRQAASTGRMESIRSGGECISKRYMEFSHMCTVVDYLPTVDYCCCAQQQLVLCCRYHQDWNHFRCNEADDAVITGPELNTTFDVQTRLTSLPPLSILLPSILVPLVITVCCVVTCIRCYNKQRRYDNEAQQCCANKRRTTTPTAGNSTRPVDEGPDDGTTTPLTSSGLPVDVMGSRAQPCFDDESQWSARGRTVEPSAPPAPSSEYYSAYVPYDVVGYTSNSGAHVCCTCGHRPTTVCTSGCGGRHVIHHTYFRPQRSDVDGLCCQTDSVANRCSSCGQQVAPPPYEEHWLRT